MEIQGNLIKLQKRSNRIENEQIRELIKIRDEKGLTQMTLYEKTGQLIGRAIKHLRNLKKDEASKVIEKFSSNGNHSNIEPEREPDFADFSQQYPDPEPVIENQPIEMPEPTIIQEIEKPKVVEIKEAKLTFAEIKRRYEEKYKNGDKNA